MDAKFHRENESRLNLTLKSQLEDSLTQVELAKSNLAHIRDKLRETEGRTEGLASENSQLRDMVRALEAKNKQLLARLQEVMKEENKGRLSMMDFKMPLDRHERDIQKGELLMELRAVRQAETADIARKPKVQVSQMVGTELRNVTRPIVYLNEHGQNVLRN